MDRINQLNQGRDGQNKSFKCKSYEDVKCVKLDIVTHEKLARWEKCSGSKDCMKLCLRCERFIKLYLGSDMKLC